MKDTVRWTAAKISRRLELIEPLVYCRREPLSPFYYKKLEGYISSFRDYPKTEDGSWVEIPVGTYWGDWYTNFALHSRFAIPDGWDPNAEIALYLPLGDAGDFCHPEALVFIDGISCASCDRYHQEVTLPSSFLDGNVRSLDLVGWTGIGDSAKGLNTRLFMQSCFVVQIHQPSREFIALARVAIGIVNHLNENEPARWHLLNALDDAFNHLDLLEPLGGEDFYKSVPEAYQVLSGEIDRAGNPLDVEILASGHAHIDVAWLWPLEQTRRKARHTFQSVVRLMEQFPEFIFTQSQPQLYDFVRQDAPQLFKTIQERVAEKKWELIGGMWVEADCNLTGPESLARQFLLGRSFFKEHFGQGSDSRVLWLPDVFGYAWNLPQLIKQAGLDYFFTIKIGWNQYNRLPFDSFWWQGLDGTRVLTHFSPTPEAGTIDSGHGASTYNAAVMPEQVIGSWLNFQQKDLAGAGKSLPLLMAFGYGDGGGGPTREMLENQRIMNQFPATPHIIPGRVEDFFRQLERDLGPKLPTWNGELYLELHRGTYTTQSRNKRANRKSEFLLHDVEFLATLAAHLAPEFEYPVETLHHAWELVCLNQFHDIIPGSSVNQVYIESQQQYQLVREQAETVRAHAVAAVNRALGQLIDENSKSLLVINPTGFTRNDLAFWPGELPARTGVEYNGLPVLFQSTIGGTWIGLAESLPFSVTRLYLRETAGSESNAPVPSWGLSVSADHLENNFIRVEFNADGDITRIYDKVNSREVLPNGALANQFQAFEDRPLNWDAWDIDIFYDDHQWLSQPASSIEIVAAGPLRAALKITRRILHSDYTQTISLGYNSPRLDFETQIDWREKHVLLKVAFPVKVLSPTATYEIQWGNVERPTHRNTSWDWARFETCAQKWVDLSEGGYGVSLLNDCKYGHDIHENIMRISLLRSPTLPDPQADQGEHQFVYSLLPHKGKWNEATVAAAYALNDPLWVVDLPVPDKSTVERKSVLPVESLSFMQVDSKNIVIETIKQAEDGNGIIVRLYECLRDRKRVTLSTGFSLKEAWKANLLEENLTSIGVIGNQVQFDVSPYEIVTLRLLAAAK